MILTKTPLEFGFDTVLWTRAIIAHIILNKFSISLHETSIGRILKANKLTPQKPIRKSYRQNKEEVKQFCEDFFPQLFQQAQSENATIAWLDESAISSESNIGQTWGLSGITPIIPSNGEREKINVIGTIDQSGVTHFMTYKVIPFGGQYAMNVTVHERVVLCRSKFQRKNSILRSLKIRS